jgi:DNA repair protein RecN (Recombination protein N)
MITRLYIKNYAIIEELDMPIAQGLTIVTGETGAGKSILLGALSLILGQRADTKVLYNNTSKCIVEGHFDIKGYDLLSFFADNDLDYTDEIIIRREITPSGQSRAFVNDSPVNLAILKRLSENLIDMHRQFDTLDIHDVSFQLRMIDALANNKDLLDQYTTLYKQYTKDQRTLHNMLEESQKAFAERDFLQFQLDELLQARLSNTTEQTTLEQELKLLSNAEHIKMILAQTHQHLANSEINITAQLTELAQRLRPLRDFSTEITDVYTRLDSLTIELDDLASEIQRIEEETEYDLERIETVKERLDTLYKLQNKHHVSDIQALLDIQNRLDTRLQSFADITDQIEILTKTIQKTEHNLLQLGKQLSERRHAVVSHFEGKVHAMLAQLSMPHAQLKIQVQTGSELLPTGIDKVAFLFAANKGSRLEHIKDVASGGEISRLTLCTKSLVASAIPLPTLIFDEIDAGVSGDVAMKMGGILRQLADKHQVITITHSPQIAACADMHYFVYKKLTPDERTLSGLRLLNPTDQIHEIATMLSGNPPSEAALRNAADLRSMYQRNHN